MTMPKYQVIATDIRTKILDAELRPGDTIPSYAKLQTLYGASYVTVREALLHLRATGYIAGQQGVAMFVTAPKEWKK